MLNNHIIEATINFGGYLMHVTIIGAGPRGLVTLERLIERFRHDSRQLTINIIDPYGIGGRVWQTDQPHELIMNSNANFVSLFTDESVKIDGPIVTGPSLFAWSQTDSAKEFINGLNLSNNYNLIQETNLIKKNDYPSRSLFGAYQRWFYQHLLSNLPGNVDIKLINNEVLNIAKNSNQFIIELNNQKLTTDSVTMSLGHIENQLNDEEQLFSKFAKINHLTYLTPTHPQEYDFKSVAANEPVILRGLGLSFSDAITLLTKGRDGYYSRDDNSQLIYHPSGKEPKIIAGSPRGIPFHAKGINQKSTNENYPPRFFTTTWIENHQQPGSLDGKEFIKLAHKEIEYVYYEKLIQLKYPAIDLNEFLDEFTNADNHDELIHHSAIKPTDYWNWAKVLGKSNEPISIEDYLIADITDAKLGNKTGPYTAAFNMFHDIRDVIRQIVNKNLLSDEDYQKYFLNQFKKESSFLSAGPPESRSEELLALIKAGIVTILKPKMKLSIDHKTNKFIVFSEIAPNEKFHASFVIEARLPAVNVEETTSNLITNLIESGLASPYLLKLKNQNTYTTGAINTISNSEQLSSGLYFWGVPTEGKRWFTTVSPRPNNNDIIFSTADKIAQEIQSM